MGVTGGCIGEIGGHIGRDWGHTQCVVGRAREGHTGGPHGSRRLGVQGAGPWWRRADLGTGAGCGCNKARAAGNRAPVGCRVDADGGGWVLPEAQAQPG